MQEELPEPLWAKIDVRGFAPGELKVQASKESGRVRITGRREETGPHGASFIKTFVREVEIDTDKYDISTLKCRLIEGLLYLQAEPNICNICRDEKMVFTIDVDVL